MKIVTKIELSISIPEDDDIMAKIEVEKISNFEHSKYDIIEDIKELGYDTVEILEFEIKD